MADQNAINTGLKEALMSCFLGYQYTVRSPDVKFCYPDRVTQTKTLSVAKKVSAM
jgi:hypothetical protein